MPYTTQKFTARVSRDGMVDRIENCNFYSIEEGILTIEDAFNSYIYKNWDNFIMEHFK